MPKEILLIDGHGLAFRGFYALPEDLCAADGTPTNAILGFMNMLFKALDEWPGGPAAIFFDAKGPTARHLMFEDYKGGRKPTPEAFKIQLPLIMELCTAMGLPVFSREGVEADDCIAATARACASEGVLVRILSADKDLFQTIDENITVIRPSRGVTDFVVYDANSFEEKYGFKPPLMADYLALTGDSVDNIPGVPGIGEKTAKELVGNFGSLEKIYENLEAVAKARRSKLEENRDLAFRCRELIIPQPTDAFSEESLEAREPDVEKVLSICAKLGLKKIAERFRTPAETASEGPHAAALPAEAKVVPLAALLKSGDIAAACGESGMVLADRNGCCAAFGPARAEDEELFRDWAERGTLYLYGLRELLTKFPSVPLPPAERIHDFEAENYLLHPDRGGRSGIARALDMPLPEGRDLALRLFGFCEAFEGEMAKTNGLERVMRDIDIPLSFTLAKMGRTGIHADAEMLSVLEKELASHIADRSREIEEYVGEKINLASPKQVAHLLFETLRLPPIKKNKSGFSTDSSVLEELAKLPEPLCNVPRKILDYREESKLQTGFVQPFLNLAREGRGFIHSTFDHLATGTGRLASRDPNVQNMPVFGEWADRFRACFTPRSADHVFVAADYSQIELRVLAHFSGEKKLIESFREGRDIHSETASWVFGLPAEDISPEQRRFAKTVNFGLIYGMSAFGLAQRLGISRPAAANMVDRYFAVLPKVKEYISGSIAEAKAKGHTVSLFGRIRPLAEVATVEGRGNNPLDRVAVNSPIQSTASDIAKIALLKFDAALEKSFPSASVVLQVHDSIVCECRREDADEVEKLLLGTMESVNVLDVPIKAEPKRSVSLKGI